MNKLNLLLLIALVAFASGCRKVELPDPKVEEAVFGFWSGQIGETPMVMNNDSMYMSTKITNDPLMNINTFETAFTALGSTQPRWILKYMDSKSMRTNADTSDLFYISDSRYLKANQNDTDVTVVTHSLNDIKQGHEVIWGDLSENTFRGGRHFSFERTSAGGVNVVKASISDQGKINSIEKRFKPVRRDLSIQDVTISYNKITIILESHSQGNVEYKMNGVSYGSISTFPIPTSGEYKIEISDTAKERHLELIMNLEVSNGTLRKPILPLFTSTYNQYPKLPNFSKMEIIYFDEDGKEYSTRYSEQPKPFIIKEIETFHKVNQLGQKVKKLNIEFSVKLKTANGIDSLVFTGVKGDIGFAYE